MRTFTLLLISIGIFASCQAQKRNKNVDGGSCSYKHEKYPAVILWIDSSNVADCDLQLLLPKSYNDTIYYSMKMNNWLNIEKIRSEKLKTGDTITYQQSHMIEGSCNPFIERILLEKYRKKNP